MNGCQETHDADGRILLPLPELDANQFISEQVKAGAKFIIVDAQCVPTHHSNGNGELLPADGKSLQEITEEMSEPTRSYNPK